MDEKFVQGIVGGVLNRHKNHTLDRKRIDVLSVEITSNIELAMKVMREGNKQLEQKRNYDFIMSEMSEGELEH